MTNPYRNKLAADYQELQGRIRWKDLRRKAVQVAPILPVGLGYTSGADPFAVLLMFLILPLGVIALLQTVSRAGKKRRLKDPEDILARDWTPHVTSPSGILQHASETRAPRAQK